MSADSEPPAAPEPVSSAQQPAPPPPAEDTTAPEFLPQKRRHKRPEPTADFELTEGEDDEILILGTLLQRLLAKKQQTDSPEPETRTRINRFVQKNTVPPGGPPPAGVAPGETGDSRAGTEGGAAAPAPTVALPKLTPRMTSPTGDEPWATPASRSRGILYFVFCAGLAIAAFLVGRGASHPAAAQPGAVNPAATPAPQWNSTLLGKLDQTLTADQSGDLKSAKDQALDLKKQLGSSLEIELYLGSLTTRLGHTNDAEADLSRLLEPYMQPLQAAAVNEAMAFTYTRRRDFKRAAEAFADASRINPFEPNNYYRWGEVLRRQGRFQDAVDKFREALQRLPEGEAESESQRECAGFKMRLAQIELGHDAEVKSLIDNRLRQPSPNGYWLLTAAAFALQHGDMPGAADAFQKARDVLPASQYAALTDDYFFHGFAEKPEVANFLPVASAEAKQQKKAKWVYFIDP